MKKIFVAAILLMSAITIAVVSAGKAFCLINEDGFAVPASAGVAQLLAGGGGGEAISLTYVQYDDVVYQHIDGYYVGQQRSKIDITYPLYTHGGSGVRFLDEENWLITPEVNVYQTFDGLYLSDGISYNPDMSQADEGEEFIFLFLTNGLYMNAQQATLSTPRGERVIPANSILSLTENAARWMEQRSGTLGYDSEEDLFDATLTIGDHTYSYSRLLDALGLIKKAIEAGGNGQPDPGILDRAEGVLNAPANEKGPESSAKPAGNESETGPDNGHELGGNGVQSGIGNGDDGQLGNEDPSEDDGPGADDTSDRDKNDGDDRNNDNTGGAGAVGGDGTVDGTGSENSGSASGGNSGETSGGSSGGTGGESSGSASGGSSGETSDGSSGGTGSESSGSASSGTGGETSGGSSGGTGGKNGSSAGSGSDSGSSGGSSGSGGESGGSASGGSDSGSSGGEDTGGDASDTDDPSAGDDPNGAGDISSPVAQSELRVRLLARKRVNGEPAQESLFWFQLKDKDGEVIQEVKNTGDRVAFEPLLLSEEGTYTYYIQEEEDIDPDFYYDLTMYRAEVTVTKNEKEKLEAVVVYYNNETNTRLSGIPVIQNGEAKDPEGIDGIGNQEGSGVSRPAPYRDPVVTLTDFNLWSYAADMTLTIDDPSGAIQKGVKVAVYRDLKQKPTNHIGATQQGNVWVWPADYEGTSLTMRQTKTRTQSFALSPLQPGETYYIQYTYRYDEKTPVYEVEKDENGKDKIDEQGNPVYKKDENGNYVQAVGVDGVGLTKSIRHYVTSPLTEVTLPALTADTVSHINASWNTTYAAASDGLQLTGLTMRNSSDYISDGSFSFALVDADGNEIQTKRNTGGLVTFDKLSFQQAGVYSYRIVQKQADMEGVVCDDAVYEAVIWVRASKGTNRLIAFVSYRKNGELSGIPAFINTTSADGVGTGGGDVSQYPASSEATGPDGTPSENLRAARVALTAGVTLDGKLTSGSSYDWENFQKNILPYTDRLELTLTPVGGGQKVTVAAGASVLNNAANGIAMFQTASGTLQPNKQYTYTAQIKDRYGNVIPMSIKEGTAAGYIDSTDFSGTVYTQKRVPVATITEMANETSTLTLKIKISDPDGALAKAENGAFEPLRLTMGYSDGAGGTVYSDLDGTLGIGVSHPGDNLAEGEPREKEKILLLENPQDNKEYTITLTSLAFSRLFETKVEGRYSPQPDFSGTPEILEQEDAVFGTLNVYTARISDGVIGFTSSFSDLTDTSVTVNLRMATTTTQDILALVDEFRFSLVDASGDRVNLNAGDTELLKQLILKKSELSKLDGLTYNDTDKTVVLTDGGFVRPTVKLYGTQAQWTDSPTSWDAFCVRRMGPDLENPTYTTPMELRLSLPKDALKPNTAYTLTVEPVVIKSGEEYPVPVRLTNTAFTTKKIRPEISYTLLAIADKLTFSELTITDPQGAILNDGEVNVELRDANSGLLINTQKVKVKETPKDLTFDGIITGAAYNIRFIAPAYNDTNNAAAQGRNVLLELNVIGSSGINGTLELTNLEQQADGTFTAKVTISAQDIAGLLARPGEKAEVTLTLEQSKTMNEPYYELKDTFKLPLVSAGEGSSALTLAADAAEKIFESLDAEDGFRVTLTASYSGYNGGEPITLAQITFRTVFKAIYVSTHQELVWALGNSGPYKNYGLPVNVIVTADFEQDPNLGVSLVCGVVDFQGHRVWRRSVDENNRPVEYKNYFLQVNSGGTVKNLVYDYPETTNTVTVTIPIFGATTGTIEDIIVRTHSPIVAKNCLLAASLSSTGLIRNFIFSFERDIRLSYDSGNARLLINHYISGKMENGYVYAKNDAGILGVDPVGSLLWGWIGYGGSVSNFYVASSIWSWTTYNNYAFTGGIKNCYISGDYYSITPDTPKSTNTRLSTLRIAANSTTLSNAWAITRYSYTMPTGTRGIYHALQPRLWDVEWQKSVLGDGFEIENSVTAGFYPRLNLSAEMQKYQEYVPLPQPAQSSTPTLISDEPDSNITLKSGRYKLRFQNKDERSITSVTIDGLTVAIAPVQQKLAADGLWDVYVDIEVAPGSVAKYLSSYTVSKFSYSVGTSASQEVTSGYKTSGIEFWKEIWNTGDWAAINDHMDWNYKVMNDIAFSGEGVQNLNPGDVIINGTRTLQGRVAFTGKLDGQEYVLKGIQLENVESPWLFYELNAAAEVRSLFVEGLTITAGSSQLQTRAGLFGSSAGTVENVRMKNCSLTAGGSIGLLMGSGGGTATDCSVVDSTLTDKDCGATVYAGGLFGYSNPVTLRCYTRNVTLDVTRSATINGVGGLVGYRGTAGMTSSYAHGRITAATNYAGGLCGSHTNGDVSTTKLCWSYVNIRQTSGDYAGGLFGHGNANALNCAALGDVSGAGDHTYRIGARGGTNSYYYENQAVEPCIELTGSSRPKPLTSEQLASPETWLDVVCLGGDWNCREMAGRYLPKLKNDCARPEWQQKDISVPGLSGEPKLSLTRADYSSQTSVYTIVAQLDHPGLSHSELRALTGENALQVVFEGLEIGDGKATLTLAPYGTGTDPEGTLISITAVDGDFTRAFDNYALSVRYNGGSELACTVSFINADTKETHRRWLDVPDLETWKEVVQHHGDTNENVRITAMLDFTSYALEERGLRFNRLSGMNEATCGFKVVRFNVGGSSGEPWFDKIATSCDNITFQDCVFNFEGVTEIRSRTGVFNSVANADRVTLKNVRMYGNNRCDSFGFFSLVNGTVSHITMDTVCVKLREELNRNASRAGALVGTLDMGGAICGDTNTATTDTNFAVRASNILVVAPRHNYVGSVVGGLSTYGMDIRNVTVDGVHIEGRSYVGGMAGYDNGKTRYVRVTGKAETYSDDGVTSYAMNVVTGTDTYVGGICGSVHTFGTTLHAEGLQVTTTAGQAGGLAGSIDGGGGAGCSNSVVKDCVIKGTTHVGGVSGFGYGGPINVQIVGCTIESTSTTYADLTKVSAGGLIGYVNATGNYSSTIGGIVIRDTEIKAPANAGGLYGRYTASLGRLTFDRVYVAEDVTVTATGKLIPASGETAAHIDLTTPAPAGGVIGYGNRDTFRDVICGATVTSASTQAGGLVGLMDPTLDNDLGLIINRTAYVGSVKAHNYAGGLVGLINGASVEMQFTWDSLMNSVVAADVAINEMEGKLSVWANLNSDKLDAGRGSLYVFEGSTLRERDGEARAVKEIFNALDTGEQNNTSLIPTQADGTRLWATTENLSAADWYTGTLQWPVAEWDFAHLSSSGNTFMPYVMNYKVNNQTIRQVLQYANHTSDGTAAGIRIPQYTTAAAMSLRAAPVRAIYVSGVDTLTAEGYPELTINGETFRADQDGLITFTWDFDSELTVNGSELSYGDYARTVMTWGDHWYVIDGGALHYGSARGASAEDMAEIGTVAGIGIPIHLWQGKVLTAEGKVYSLSSGTASGETDVRDNGKQVAVSSIYQNGGIEVYYGFTRVDGERVDSYRVFRMNGVGPRVVALSEDAVYDGIVLNQTGSIVLRGGRLVSSMSLDLAEAYPAGINQISNSFGYDGTAILLRYDGGGVKGVDYVNGFEFFSTQPQSPIAAFAGYVKSAVKHLMSPIFGGGQDSLIMAEPSLAESEQLQNALGNREPGTAMGLESDKTPNDPEVDAGDGELKSDPADGTVGDIVGGPGDGPAGEPDAGKSGGEDGSSEADGSSAAEGEGEVTGTFGDGDWPQDANAGDTSETGNEIPGAAADQTDGAVNGVGSLPGETGELTGETGELTGETGELTGETGELTGETGELTGETGELTGETGELTGETGELSGKTGEQPGTGNDPTGDAGEGEKSPGKDMGPAADASGKSKENVDAQRIPEERLVRLFGDSVVLYSETTGKYELFATETMLSNEPVGYQELLARRSGEQETVVQGEPQESHFSVTGWGLGRSLDAAEKQGFALLIVASGIAFIGLGVLYTIVRRRKK